MEFVNNIQRDLVRNAGGFSRGNKGAKKTLQLPIYKLVLYLNLKIIQLYLADKITRHTSKYSWIS